MIAALINALAVTAGGTVGLIFKNHIKEKYLKAIMVSLALCVFLVGLKMALETKDMLGVIICMVVGTVIGELLKIEDRLDGLGGFIKSRVMKNHEGGRFTEAFMSTTLLFCVGSMSITGSLEAGINQDYTIILSKSAMDCVTAVTFGATMGVGTLFSAFPILIYQGAWTLIGIFLGPLLPQATIVEMSAVGGLLIIAMGFNMLNLAPEKLRVGNMLPCLFIPAIYIPAVQLVTRLMG